MSALALPFISNDAKIQTCQHKRHLTASQLQESDFIWSEMTYLFPQ